MEIQFNILYKNKQFSLYHMLTYSSSMPVLSYSKIPHICGFYFRPLFCPTDILSSQMPMPHYPNYVKKFFHTVLFFFQNVLALLGPFSSIQTLNSTCQSTHTPNSVGILTRDALHL